MQYTNLGPGDIGRRDPLDCDDEVEVQDCDGCGTETVKDELEESMSGKWLCEDCSEREGYGPPDCPQWGGR